MLFRPPSAVMDSAVFLERDPPNPTDPTGPPPPTGAHDLSANGEPEGPTAAGGGVASAACALIQDSEQGCGGSPGSPGSKQLHDDNNKKNKYALRIDSTEVPDDFDAYTPTNCMTPTSRKRVNKVLQVSI